MNVQIILGSHCLPGYLKPLKNSVLTNYLLNTLTRKETTILIVDWGFHRADKLFRQNNVSLFAVLPQEVKQ